VLLWPSTLGVARGRRTEVKDVPVKTEFEEQSDMGWSTSACEKIRRHSAFEIGPHDQFPDIVMLHVMSVSSENCFCFAVKNNVTRIRLSHSGAGCLHADDFVWSGN
jgi:hypothetical protein